MTTLLLRLQQALAASRDPVKQAEIRAEIALYMTRLGEIEAAEECVRELRRNYGKGSHERILLLVMLVEGVICFFRSEISTARDRILRSTLLAQALGLEDLLRLGSAWMAHIDFNCNSIDSMAAHATRVGRIDLGNPNAAACRLSLTMADAFAYIDNPERAKAWYAYAHQMSASAGDEAGLAAWLYNRTAMRLARLRVSEALGVPVDSSFQQLALEVQSTNAFQRLAGHRSLNELIDALFAREYLSKKDYGAALPYFQRILAEGKNSAVADDTELLKVEMYRCAAHVADPSEAIGYCKSIPNVSLDTLSVDDRLLFWHSAVSLATQLGMSELVDQFHVEKSICQEAFSAEQSAWAAALNSLDQALAPIQPIQRQPV